MKKILVVGAGRSSANLIKYLLDHAEIHNWHIRVGDMDKGFAQQKIGRSVRAEAFQLNASDSAQRQHEIGQADLVISMLPASMHLAVAKDCLDLRKHLITPSYIADEMWTLDQQVRSAGLVFLNEMGVDPGIDHMSAMKIIHELKAKGAKLESFESFTGGLIAPQSDNNPWRYKITWNPRNVVLAGYGGTARYRENNTLKFIPYHRLFERITPVDLGSDGLYEGYANRDSLKYLKLYDLQDIPTLYRGTLRKGGFCSAWNALIQIGLTDDSFTISDASRMTWLELTESFLPEGSASAEKRMQQYLGLTEDTVHKLRWLGLFETQPLGIEQGSPAQALQKLIEKKWGLSPDDKDLIVMWHRFRYSSGGKRYELQSKLLTEGDDPVHTAMSKTVGLPIAIAAKFILTGRWNLSGVLLPTQPEIYEPVLDELCEYGISFRDSVTELP